MTAADRERMVARVLSGRERLLVRGRHYWLRPPTPADRHEAAEAYRDELDRAEAMGLMGEHEVASLLERLGLWSAADAAELATCEKNLETLKVDLFKAAFSERERELARKLLAATRTRLAQLLARRHQFDGQTAEAAAATARTRLLVARCLEQGGRPVWGGDPFEDDSPLLDAAVSAYLLTRLSEAELREMARTEPWRSVWACRHSEGRVFGVPAAALTDEQRVLSVWSRVYDNAYEDPDCPPESVVSDDDMFDGWMILRRKERDEDMQKKRAHAALENEKIASSGEVFVAGAAPGRVTPSHSAEDRAGIESLNDAEARAAKAARLRYLQSRGVVHEADMPDSRREISMELARRGRK